MQVSRFIASMLSAGMATFGASAGYAQDYPSKTIRILTGSPGGGSDFTARQIAGAISGPLGQPVVVENRAGVQATETVAKAPPDGYTLLVFGSSVWILTLLQKMPYDVSNFSPISLISREVSVVSVHPSLPVKSVKDLISLAQAKPGQLNYASGTTGAPNHLSAELFKSMAGVNIVRVTYKGGGPAMAALVGGEVQVSFYDAGPTMPHVKTGRLRALAVTSAEPSALAPGLPTVAASGVPGYESVGMSIILAPAKTPASVITRLNQEVVRFLNSTGVKERFLASGSETVGTSAEQLAAIIKADMARAGKVIKEAGIKVE